jgi:hypothetical protein
MEPLQKVLQEKKSSLSEFKTITLKILNYLPNVLSKFETKYNYRLYQSNIAGTQKYIRPINIELFIDYPTDFISIFEKFESIINEIKKGKRSFQKSDKVIIDKCMYTIQQSIGAGLDLLVNPNSARKHVGNRFEELIQCIFTEIGVTNKKLIVTIPYETDEGQKIYKCENDLVLSPFDAVKSTTKNINPSEIVVSVKTTSKDRMSKIFIDKILLERFVEHPVKMIGIFLNDVQRKEENNITYTLVSGLFMVYTKFLTEIQGIYYLDPPPNVFRKPFSNHMKSFSDLITLDVFKLLTS